ncbi:MAG: DivIVA domain-containing protein [Lachnospirales bacterium]
MITPVDIKTKEFKKSAFGFSQDEVQNFLEELTEEFEAVYKENAKLKSQNQTLAEAVNYYRSMEDTIKASIVTAEKNAEETKKLAEKEADIIIKKAENHAEELLRNTRIEASNLRNEIMALESRYIGLKDGLKAVFENQIKMLDIHSDMFKKENSEE